MKLRRMFFLLVLLLGQIGSVSTDAWMIWNHLRDFHGVEHVCRHECDVCLAHHSASVRCNCLRDHNEADRQLYVCSNGDASHRQHPCPFCRRSGRRAYPTRLRCRRIRPIAHGGKFRSTWPRSSCTKDCGHLLL